MSKKLEYFKSKLRSGTVYRRSELEQWSNAVDRHIKLLVSDGTLKKLYTGMYYYPKETTFGTVPADEKKLVRTFLKDDRFLLTSLNTYNALGMQTTQLYNERIVYNHKRHGLFKLGNQTFDFRVKPYFPNSLSKEFLLVDLVNNLDSLAEDSRVLLEQVKETYDMMDSKKVSRMVKNYGNVRTKKVFDNLSQGNPN